VNVTARCQTTTALIDWRPVSNGSGEVFSCVVYYRALDAEAGSYDSVSVNATSTLVLVRPWLNYTFHVKASNEIGESDASEVAYCTTLPTAPFQHPRNVCTQTRLSNQLVIIWQVRPSYSFTVIFYTSPVNRGDSDIVLYCTVWTQVVRSVLSVMTV